MLSYLPSWLKGLISSFLLALNTVFWCALLFPLSIIKGVLPFAPVQRALRYVMHEIASGWIAVNGFWMHAMRRIEWDIQGLPAVDMRHSFLVTSNHQSWVDIFALQYQFNRRLPMLKFFLKQQLIWVPVIGLAWWALEFPFMKRYSKAYLAKHPEKKGQDLITTRKACERFKTNPVSVFNFLEGTRFTPGKHAEQQSPYEYLLRPKAGGIAFVLDAMGEQLSAIIDVTIAYPDGRPSLWDLLSGQVRRIVVRVQQRDIPQAFIGHDYDQDERYRTEFQAWVNALWQEKEVLMREMSASSPHK